MGSVTVVGLGPGEFGFITMGAWEAMQGAKTLRLRTAVHPTVEEIQRRGVAFVSYDDRYENATSFESLYTSIVDDLLVRAKCGEDVVYAVPGSPFVAERSVVLLRERAVRDGVQLSILPGMSFVEVMYARLGIDPINGLTILDAGDVCHLPAHSFGSIVITQVYSQRIASDTKLSLMEILPDEYEIIFMHNLGLPDESVRRIPLYALDRQSDIDHLTSLYLPPR